MSYFQKAFILFKEINNKKFLFHSINCIIELYLIKNNYNEALLQSKQAYELLNGIKDLELQLRFYNNMSLIYEKLDNYEKSLYFHKLYADVKDSLLSWEHKQKLIEMEAKYQSKKREKEIINKNVKISLLKKDQEIEAYKLWGLILLIIVGVTFVIALNKRIITAKQLYEQKIKNNETQKLLVEAELTNQRLKNLQLQQKLDFKQKELDYKNNQLIKFASYITQKNDFLKKLKSKLLSLNNNFDINELKELLDAYTRSLDKDRQEFETNIKEISQTFLLRIRELVPNLTKNEERMLVLLRLNLSSKEIATILKTTLRSVEMARHRLRKKFNLGPDENLNEFLKKI